MKKLWLVSLALAAALVIAPAAVADTFNFTFTSSGASFSGQLVGTGNSGVFAITSGSGVFTDLSGCCGGIYSVVLNLNSPLPANSGAPYPYFTYDNLLTPGAPAGGALDLNGLLAFNGSDGTLLNIWGNGTGQPYSWMVGDSGGYRESGNDGTVIVTSAVPEPSSLLFLSTGLLGIAGVVRRRWPR